jgi:hypothetical protein
MASVGALRTFGAPAPLNAGVRPSTMKIELNLLANAQDSLDRAFELVVWGDQQH